MAVRHLPAIAVAVAALCGFCAAESIPWNETVLTDKGWVRGSTVDNVHVFNSIPFAAPPTGQNRFAPPQPAAPWSDVKDVRDGKPSCPQLKFLDHVWLGQEDCLYLRVYVPERDPDDFLPVFFWIYGGGWVFGDDEEFGYYDGKHMANTYNVIVVAVEYRVASLGFLAMDELLKADGTTGNYGVQDQTMGLKWVQANIHNFGGDPSRVTIAGESAGAFSVAWHLASKASAGLFHGAIMESGTADSPQFFRDMAYATKYSTEFANGCGCPPGSATSQVTCLRDKSMTDVLACDPSMKMLKEANATTRAHLAAAAKSANGYIPALWPIMPWGAVIDGSDQGLTDVPLRLVERGDFNKVNLMIGTNNNEGSIFIPALPIVDPGTSFPPSNDDLAKAIVDLFEMYDPAVVQPIAKNIVDNVYPVSDYGDKLWNRATQVLTDEFFACASRRLARSVHAAGLDVYMYHFDFDYGGLLWDFLGDYHTSELQYVFGNPFPPIITIWDEKQKALSAAMGLYWTNFVQRGTPNDGAVTTVPWPQYNSSQHNIRFASPITLEQQYRSSFCDMWDAAVKNITAHPVPPASSAGASFTTLGL